MSGKSSDENGMGGVGWEWGWVGLGWGVGFVGGVGCRGFYSQGAGLLCMSGQSTRVLLVRNCRGE